MVNLIDKSLSTVKTGADYTRSKLNEAMVQHSLFAAITFLIVSHPATFKFTDNIFKIKNKNILLLIHAGIVGLIMYFASIYLFTPILNMILSEGMRNKKKQKTPLVEGVSNECIKDDDGACCRYTLMDPAKYGAKQTGGRITVDMANEHGKDMYADDMNVIGASKESGYSEKSEQACRLAVLAEGKQGALSRGSFKKLAGFKNSSVAGFKNPSPLTDGNIYASVSGGNANTNSNNRVNKLNRTTK